MALPLTVIALLAAASAAEASTFEVTREDDPAPAGCTAADCSLREAVIAANASPGRDTILVEPIVGYDLEIAGQNEDLAQTGDLDSRGRLKIKPSGPGRSSIDAHFLDRGIDAFKRLTLIRLGVTNGDVDTAGGGVRAVARLRIVSATFAMNQAAFDGGAIWERGGSLELIHSDVFGNSTNPTFASGGGVAAEKATIDRSEIVSNDAASCGAASFSSETSTTITRSVIAENDATFGGGALCAFLGTLKVRDSAITNNEAHDGPGGALHLQETTGSISRSTIARNVSTDRGAGIDAVGADLVISRSTIHTNGALDDVNGTGGGISVSGTYRGEGTGVRLANSTVANNDAAAGGGGIYVAHDPGYGDGNVRLAFTTIVGNDGDQDDAGNDIGGGILQGANATFGDVRGSLIALNEANTEPDCAGTVASTGHNLLSDATGCIGLQANDLIEPDPKLGALGTHGGPTETIPLKAASAAINAAGRKGPRTDQRGVRRPQGPRYDIGAFERRR
jgi:fibronectin-binding autotransporter adhesin